MSRFVQMLLTFLGLFAILSCATLPSRPGQFQLKSYQEVQLDNGLPVLLIEDKSLPYFSLGLMIKSGEADDPAGQSGVASLVGDLLNKGTTSRSAEQISDSLAQIGADFSVSVGTDYTMISASSLSFHAEGLLRDFAEILTEPTFTQSEVNRSRQRRLANLQRVVDQPSSFAHRAFQQLLYGEEHPYGPPSGGRLEEVRQMRRAQIIRYYLTHYRPNNAHLAVVGNFEKNQVIETLNSLLAGWEARDRAPLEYGEFPVIEGRSLILVNKSDLQQTQILIGHRGIRRDDPDFLALRVANTVLGGAFSSRLMDEIREARGLTYSVSSSTTSGRDFGLFSIRTATRHDRAGETLQVALDVLDKFVKEGVTETEVRDAKALLTGLFPRAIETPERLAENLLVLRYHGISDSYLKNYIRDLNRLRHQDINRAIRKHFDPDNLKIVLLTNRAQVKDQLGAFENIQVRRFEEFR